MRMVRALPIMALPLALGGGRVSAAATASPQQIAGLIARMDTAYAPIDSYQTETVVHVYRDGKLRETERFLYRFTKPDHLRIELRSPHAGAVLTYPDVSGKVAVKPGGLLGFVKLHLGLDSSTFRTTAGQRLNQTDMGTLIRNITHSLTDGRHGPVTLSERGDALVAEVLADDHFLPGVLTLYRFTIDTVTWLPVHVDELTPDDVPKRSVAFLDFAPRLRPSDDPSAAAAARTKHGAGDR
jgi:hypothetical protein